MAAAKAALTKLGRKDNNTHQREVKFTEQQVASK
jgi:hypothetical protein